MRVPAPQSNPPRGCDNRRPRPHASVATRPSRIASHRSRAAPKAAAGRHTPSAPGTPSKCRSGACRRARPARLPSVGHAHVHGEYGGGRRVDRHGRRNVPRSMPRTASPCRPGRRWQHRPARPLPSPGVVGVTAQQRRHVERGRQPVTARTEQLLEATVRVSGRAEPRELAHRPQAGAVHGGVGPSCVGVLAGKLRALGPVDRFHRHTRHRLEPR